MEVVHHGLPVARAGGDAVVDGAVQQTTRFFGHAESSRSQRLVDVLGSRARQRELEVVDDPCAIGRDGGNESLLHQRNQDRRQAGLEDVGADAPDDAVLRVPCRAHCLDDSLEVG